MKQVFLAITVGFLGATAACSVPEATPTAQPQSVSTLTATPSPSVLAATPSSTAVTSATPITATPTSFPGPPQLIEPADAAMLPQPVPPAEWVFSWMARDGPCYGAITIQGPGGRRLGSGYIDYHTIGYRYVYASTEVLPDDALGPWSWFVDVICPMGNNRSEIRTFWVATASPDSSPPGAQPGLVVRGRVRLTDDSGLADVRLCRSFAAYPGETVAISDRNGFYQSEFVDIPGDEMVSVWPEAEGYRFEPRFYDWRHYHGYEVRLLDFVAIPTKATEVPPGPCR